METKYDYSVKTNFFHVKDESTFRIFMSNVVTGNDDLNIETSRSDGALRFSFSARSLIIGVDYGDDSVSDSGDHAFDDFLTGLQELVDEDDAIIMMEYCISDSGDIGSTATVITAYDTDYLDLREIATEVAEDMIESVSPFRN